MYINVHYIPGYIIAAVCGHLTIYMERCNEMYRAIMYIFTLPALCVKPFMRTIIFLCSLFLTPDAKTTGCYKFDVSVCVGMYLSVCGIVAPKRMIRF